MKGDITKGGSGRHAECNGIIIEEHGVIPSAGGSTMTVNWGDRSTNSSDGHPISAIRKYIPYQITTYMWKRQNKKAYQNLLKVPTWEITQKTSYKEVGKQTDTPYLFHLPNVLSPHSGKKPASSKHKSPTK